MHDDDLLARADTVTLFVHGVGLHTSDEMTHAAEIGFWHARGRDTHDVRVRPLQIAVHPDDPAEKVAAFAIRTPHENHVVVPMVWCGIRRRVVALPFSPLATRLNETPVGAVLSLPQAIPKLLDVCADVEACASRARTPFQRLALRLLSAALIGGVGLVTLLALSTVVAPIVLLAMQIKSNVDTPAGGGLFMTLAALVVSVTAALALVAGFRALLGPYDVIGDTAAYVSDAELRAQAMEAAATTIARIASLAPRAQILLVGHSLGSVLITDALLSSPLPPERMPILITLGSPLRRLSHFFRSVRTPLERLRIFRERGLVRSWFHYWRDGDYIGQSLMPRHDDIYSERSLGRGFHANYWTDHRLWFQVMLRAREALSPQPKPS